MPFLAFGSGCHQGAGGVRQAVQPTYDWPTHTISGTQYSIPWKPGQSGHGIRVSARPDAPMDPAMMDVRLDG
ncbi:hypothetical protein [Sphingosinicella terrae]|uniref:hypothetical protein n=1 Tax=Sphingosinicella terrae TaxID=2172047 RepID=UPI0013B405AF|nr:hypothetical protein [Sphingosinicella terrae]